jgi:hypothetical protein
LVVRDGYLIFEKYYHGGGVMGHFAADGRLSFHPAYLALAIGCGSKPFPWINDSGFWVISQKERHAPNGISYTSCL